MLTVVKVSKIYQWIHQHWIRKAHLTEVYLVESTPLKITLRVQCPQSLAPAMPGADRLKLEDSSDGIPSLIADPGSLLHLFAIALSSLVILLPVLCDICPRRMEGSRVFLGRGLFETVSHYAGLELIL